MKNLTILSNQNSPCSGLAFILDAGLENKNKDLKGMSRGFSPGDAVLDVDCSSGSDAIGFSRYAHNINNSPAANIALAQEIGMIFTESRVGSEDEIDELCRTELWMQISKTVAIRRPVGLPVLCEAYYSNGRFRNFFCKIVGTRVGYGNSGPVCGYSISTIFSTLTSPLRSQFSALAEVLKDKGYTGPVTIEAVLENGNAFYKGIRFGFDETEYGKIALCGPQIILGEGRVPKGFASTVSIYDLFEDGVTLGHKDQLPIGLCPNAAELSGTGYIRSTGRIAAVSFATGKTIIESFEKCYENTKPIKSPVLYWRTDGGRYAADWWRKAKRVFL